jgi:hypothetical protein
MKQHSSKRDIYKLRGSEENPITFEDLITVFEKMQKQFTKLEEAHGEIGRSYAYAGFFYDKESKVWKLGWDS